MQTESDFYEAWIDSKGRLYIDGYSHFRIANARIAEHAPDLHVPLDDDDYPEDKYYDFAYNWMWENGYGRLIRTSNSRITIQTCDDHPEYRLNLINKTKALCKRLGINELVCDRTGRTLWSTDDVL